MQNLKIILFYILLYRLPVKDDQYFMGIGESIRGKKGYKGNIIDILADLIKKRQLLPANTIAWEPLDLIKSAVRLEYQHPRNDVAFTILNNKKTDISPTNMPEELRYLQDLKNENEFIFALKNIETDELEEYLNTDKTGLVQRAKALFGN